MRAITGLSWDAQKSILLTFYKAAIRSILEYGGEAFNQANESLKKKLQTIQNSALRISCGADGKTNCNALLVECGEIPISLRLRQRTAIYAAKTKITPHHPSRIIYFPDPNKRSTWIKSNLSKRKPHTAPLVMKNYLNDQRIQNLQEHPLPNFDTPPWKLFLPNLDITLLGIQKEDPSAL